MSKRLSNNDFRIWWYGRCHGKVGSNAEHISYVYDWSAPMPRTTTYVYDGEISTIPSTDPTQDWANATGWRQTTLVANGAGEDLFSATRLATSRWIVSDWKQRDSRGKVVLHFRLHYDGRITDMDMTENTAGEVLGFICQKAVLDPAPFAAWPSDMRRTLGDVRNIRFTFIYY